MIQNVGRNTVSNLDVHVGLVMNLAMERILVVCYFVAGEKIIFFVSERKLVNVYTNSNDANISNAFCIDQSSCLEILAECRIDSGQPTMKFCQCPIGYQITDNKRCGKKFSDRIQYFSFVIDAIKSGQLSPLDPNPPNYGPCGVCEDENAVCTTAANERTCWCRSGYVKSGNTCGE